MPPAVIDVHAHWWPGVEFVHQRSFWPLFIRHLTGNFFQGLGFEISEAALEQQFFDPQGIRLLANMDAAGIERTVLLPLDWGLTYGEAEVDIIAQNRAHVELAAKYPGRIVPFFGIDPSRQEGDRHFRTAVRDWGVKGLKLYPPCGFYPWDERCTPYYRVCLEYGLPVIFHGSPSPMTKVAYSHPQEFAKLAQQLPELRIVIAHAGGLDWLSAALEAAREHENIFLDLSGWQAVASRDQYGDRLQKLFKITKRFDQIMFGTDNPIFNGILSAADMVTAVRESTLPSEQKALLLGGTAARLLSAD